MRRFHSRGLVVESLEAECEAVVVHAEAVEDGGVEVVDVDGILDDSVGATS